MACTFLWLMTATAGLWTLWAYDNEPGQAAEEAIEWPVDSGLERDPSRATLVLMAHPHCTCTRASLGELAEILARARTRPKAYVVFLRPTGFAEGWEQTYLWRLAKTLPDVIVLTDRDGTIAERFGAATSGQTFLYDAAGILQFSGGITGARAHPGDNEGRQAVLELLARADTAEHWTTKVFGCSLFAPEPDRSSQQ